MTTRAIVSLLLGVAAAGCAQVAPPPPAPQRTVAAPPVEPPQAEVPPAKAPPAEVPPAKLLLTGSQPGDLIPGFRATVRRAEGGGVREEPIDSLATKGATLYIVNSTRCPYCAKYADAIKGVEAAYMPRGVDVVHVYPVREEPAEEKIAWHAKKGFRGGQVLDSDAAVAKLLEADKTPTAYLVDAKGVIAYRGAVESSGPDGGAPARYLADALESVLAGKPVAVPATDPEG